METVSRETDGKHHRGRALLAVLILLLGIVELAGGGWLVVLGGSWYYLLCGAALVVTAWLLLRARPAAVGLYLAIYVVTALWTIWESGTDYWGWVPRMAVPTVLGFFVALSLPGLRGGGSRPAARGLAAVFAVIFVVAAGLAFVPYHVTTPTGTSPDTPLVAVAASSQGPQQPDSDWQVYGRDKDATRYSPLAQINAANVSGLKRAWTFRTGDLPPKGKVNKWAAETTPIKVGDAVYLCSATDDIIRLDPATGRQVWRYRSGVKYESVPYTAACRAVVHYISTQTPAGQACHTRIIESTLDERLIAVDADTGQPCEGFGVHGQVDLMKGMGESVPGFVAEPAPPPIVDGVIVTNQEVLDGQRRWAPSGVIRGYSAEDGKFLWAWDVKRPGQHGEPPPGQSYSRGTPNSWTAMIGDDALGLVYVPTGNSAADYYSALRSPEENKVSSSVVAIDVHSGEPRWVFQTVHKDVWDYDIGSQPTLMDYPGADGQAVPALLMPTKRGQTFVLDRRTGTPLSRVEERPAPDDTVIKSDPRAPTQPWSVDMPRLGFPDLTEAKMWGITPIDQLACRIKFRRARYDGEFTAPSLTRPWIEYPGYNGGSDWGSVAYDPGTGVLIANWNNTPMYDQLLTREQANAMGLKSIDDPTYKPGGGGAEGAGAQADTPYGVNVNPFMLAATQMLCNEPPYGMITAIDMHTHKVLWQRPLGTARANGPGGLPTFMPVQIGTPNNGGPIITAGGLAFVAAATDNLIRAIDIKTGKVVWSDVLPAGGQATPMTYAYQGRQYLVIMAGGHHFMKTPPGDYVIAYALPAQAGTSAGH
ncbi:membrane-bound PQQ-dependent dehydrogenase, glucose/quinate/shikimate family [Frateuria aurantia]